MVAYTYNSAVRFPGVRIKPGLNMEFWAILEYRIISYPKKENLLMGGQRPWSRIYY